MPESESWHSYIYTYIIITTTILILIIFTIISVGSCPLVLHVSFNDVLDGMGWYSMFNIPLHTLYMSFVG